MTRLWKKKPLSSFSASNKLVITQYPCTTVTIFYSFLIFCAYFAYLKVCELRCKIWKTQKYFSYYTQYCAVANTYWPINVWCHSLVETNPLISNALVMHNFLQSWHLWSWHFLYGADILLLLSSASLGIYGACIATTCMLQGKWDGDKIDS